LGLESRKSLNLRRSTGGFSTSGLAPEVLEGFCFIAYFPFLVDLKRPKRTRHTPTRGRNHPQLSAQHSAKSTYHVRRLRRSLTRFNLGSNASQYGPGCRIEYG